ncbi:uncharacterized protein LOC110676761 [Aedes aegypti]|uniref:Uncharacterized protein n=1 Tax=Aedes aegypti TaxID=7159 RepID=A0A6I8U2G0_AEDAE|nr:uncharacterized protein LOC110676761 [Aedes aegypti]
MGSDTDDDSPCESIAAQPVSKPLLRTYRRRITIDELLEDWNVGDQNATTNSGIGVNLEEPSEPIAKSSNTIECSCGMAEEAKKYKNLYESLLTATMDKEAVRQDSLDPATKEKLLKQNAELLGRNAKLQEALTSKLLPQPEVPFKDVKGDFLDAETIRLISIEADTDYLFMKFLMMRLWPEGLTGRSVTGRRSNNPSGRSKSKPSNASDHTELPESTNVIRAAEDAERATKRPLEKDRVDFLISCLYRRRVFLKDDANTAQVHTKAGISLMTRVIANSTRK